MMYSTRPNLPILPRLKQTPMRRALALACFATLVSSCESDNDNRAATFTITPDSTISEPSPLSFTTLAPLIDDIDIFGTVIADFRAAGTVADQISLTALTASTDASGNIVSEPSESTLLTKEFSPPLGNEAGGFYWQGLVSVSDFSVGNNRVTATTTFNAGQETTTQALGDVVVGSSWMKESAIQYDAAGNLYALDQIKPSLIEIDKNSGVKTELVDLSLTIAKPVDLLIDGTTAYVLSGGNAGIYSIADFAGSPSVSLLTDCSATQRFVDAVAFDADFSAAVNESRFFVADRGLKNIVLVQADAGNTCSIPDTLDQDVDDPLSDDEDDMLMVPGPILDLPRDIAYHKDTNTVFVSGAWVNFGSVGQDVLDASGNTIPDASGNPIQEATTISSSIGDFLVGVPLDGVSPVPRTFVEYRADASGNDVYGVIESPGKLVINGDDLIVFDNMFFSRSETTPGVVALDVTDAGAHPLELVVRPVSGGLRQFNESTDMAEFQFNNNPDADVWLPAADSIAIHGDDLTLLSMQLGSYINIKLGDAPTGCIDFATDADAEGAVLQCEFLGTRSLIPGGASVASASSTQGYLQSTRAGVDRVDLDNVVSTGFGFLGFNKLTGTPSVGRSSVLANTTSDNRIDQVLLSEGNALAARSVANGVEYFVAESDKTNDRLMSFIDFTTTTAPSERSVISTADASVIFEDPFAAFIRQPRRYREVGDVGIVDASEPLSYFMLDRSYSDELVRVVLDTVSDDLPEVVGQRSLIAINNDNSCNFNNATALAYTRVIRSDFTGSEDFDDDGIIESGAETMIDINGDNVIDSADDEGGETFYESYASAFVATGDAILEVDLLDNSCGAPLSISGATITSLDLDIEETLNEDEDAIERVVSIMALDSVNNELIEIRCNDAAVSIDTGLGSGLSCGLLGRYAMTLNAPESAAAINVDWQLRNVRVFDDKLNSVFLVDIAVRDEQFGPVDIADLTAVPPDDPLPISDNPLDDAFVTGQTVIETPGLPLNCDPAMDAEGCLNL